MKIINLNESQYHRLFEMSPTVQSLGDDAQSNVPPPSNGQTYVDGPTTDADGETSIIPNNDNDKADINTQNKLAGSERLAKTLARRDPRQWTGRY